MMKRSYKLAVCDIDGTLVNTDKEISAFNLDAITRFRNAGGMLSLATGRIEQSVSRFCRQLNIDIPVILYNGARIINPVSGAVLFDRCLEPSDVLHAAGLMSRYSFDFIFYSGGTAYTTARSGAVAEYENGDGIECILMDSVEGIAERKITKILMIGDPSLFDSFRSDFNDNPDCTAELIQSEHNFLEILPSGTNKGEALDRLIRFLGLKNSEVVGFGDNLNDLEMIRTAGLGVAMGNAREELKAAADLVAPANSEDGVGKVLLSILEDKLK